LVILLNSNNSAALEMHLFPGMDQKRRFHITADDVWLKLGKQLQCLSQLREAVQAICQKD